jgi:GGDEF domain-containing protein
MATDRRRNEDVLARATFNKFHLLLPGVDEAGAQVVISKIKGVVQSEDFIYRGNRLSAKLRIASITKREEDLHLQQMLQECELALFKAHQAELA